MSTFYGFLTGCDEGTLILFMALTRAIVSFKVRFYFERVIVKYGLFKFELSLRVCGVSIKDQKICGFKFILFYLVLV